MATHGMRNSREYKIWVGMKYRCLNPNAINFNSYGGRGITVCEKWLTFEGFIADMGPANGRCIDRIDNDQGYSKDNCRWVTPTENSRNRRSNVVVEGKTLSQWAKETGLSDQLIHYRIKHMGMSPLAAVTTPRIRRRTSTKEIQA